MALLRFVVLVRILALFVAFSVTASVAAPRLPLRADEGLHKDTVIRVLAGSNDPLPAPNEAFGDYFEIPCLDVVPAGKSYPRVEVFKELGIDEARTRDRRHIGIGKVEFLVWQVSPSYDLVCMTAINDPQAANLDLFDENRKVYGVRIVLRSSKNKK